MRRSLSARCLNTRRFARARKPRQIRRPRKDPGRAGGRDISQAVDRGDDEKAIKARSRWSFVHKAFNAGNAEATAATYTETAVVVDERGERLEGRAAIRDQYAASFADNPGSTIAIQVRLAPFPRPGDGPRGGPHDDHAGRGCGAPEITRFTAVYVKQGGQWLQAAVRDELAPRPRPPRPPQGTGVARGRLGQRKPGCGRLHLLHVGQRRQLPRS